MKKLVKNAIDSFLVKQVLKFKNFDASDSIIIFSEARGGSTWLTEILRDTLDVCINWEPLNVDYGVIPKDYRLGWRPYILKENSNNSYTSLFTKIHEFKIHNNWTRKLLTLEQLFRSKQVLIKYVRANMLVPYLLENFKFNYPPIFLVRHPIDTCLSQIRSFRNSNNYSTEFQIPCCLNNERFIEHKDFINKLNTRLEKKISVWCLNNCLTINQLNNYNLHIVFYSDLLLSPKKEVKEILHKYNLNNYIERLTKINLRKASSTNFYDDYRDTVEIQLYKNFKILDDSEKDKIQRIFDHFNFNLYSAYCPFPNKHYLALDEK